MSKTLLQVFVSRTSGWEARLLMALLISVVFLTAVLLGCPLRFEANDDLAMMRIVSGSYTGQPCEYMVFQNIVIGQFLRWLYTANPEAAWYTIFLYIVHLFVVAALLFAVFVHRYDFLSLFLSLLFFGLLYQQVLTKLSFTTTAFAAALAGIVLSVSTDSASVRPPRAVMFGISGALLLIAGVIRLHAMVFALILMLPLIIGIRRNARAAVWSVLLAACLLVIVLVGHHRAYYRHDAVWSTFLKRNLARGQLQDYPVLAINSTTKPYFDRVGWNENDITAFKHFFQFDQNVFSSEKFHYLVKHLPRRYSIGAGIHRMWLSFKGNIYAIVLAAAFVVLAFSVADRKRNLLLLAAAFMCGGMFAYLGIFGKIPFRIVHSIILVGAFVPILLICSLHIALRFRELFRFSAKHLLGTMITVGVLAAAGLQARRVVQYGCDTCKEQRHLDSLQEGMSRLSPGRVFVPYYNGLPQQCMSPFEGNSKANRYHSIPCGWLIGSPIYADRLKHHQIENMTQAFVDRKHLCLVIRDDIYPLSDSCLRKFFRDHYGQTVSLEHVAHVLDFGIYRIQRDGMIASAAG